VTGFAKMGLSHTSNSINAEGHYLILKRHSIWRWNFPQLSICVGAFVWPNFKSVAYKPIWGYESSKSVHWMCVEDTFSQIWSHLLPLFMNINMYGFFLKPRVDSIFFGMIVLVSYFSNYTKKNSKAYACSKVCINLISASVVKWCVAAI